MKTSHAVKTLPWWQGWTPLVALPLAAIVAPLDWPNWLFMWTLAVAIYAGCKWLTWRRTPLCGVPWWRNAGYMVAWPGLDARAFLSGEPGRPVARPDRQEWFAAGGKVLFGAVLFWGVARLVPGPRELLRGWIGMLGTVLMLHFGLFRLLSCAWRSIGVDAQPLMDRPLAARSLSEFWGRRWNTAFRDLTHRFLFRPVAGRVGATAALVIGFLFSGVVHGLVISLPARGGYGGPTLFFSLQAVGILVERSRWGRQKLGLGRGARGWLFAMTLLAAPAWWLFHPPFIRRVVLPMMEACGAL